MDDFDWYCMKWIVGALLLACLLVHFYGWPKDDGRVPSVQIVPIHNGTSIQMVPIVTP
ncbi:MAG: hypothetical protein HF312_15690 [Ignavibacteria bacterium]|jgi:hypothetical protein|nr:hypothetical protein [Ignavibacteria bacterium]